MLLGSLPTTTRGEPACCNSDQLQPKKMYFFKPQNKKHLIAKEKRELFFKKGVSGYKFGEGSRERLWGNLMCRLALEARSSKEVLF